jgi:P-type Mg2+ transporter
VIPAIGMWLTVSPLAPTLGFVALPRPYWLLLAAMLLAYMVLTQAAKSWFHRRYGE